MAKKNEEKVELRPTVDNAEDFVDIEVYIKNRRIGKLSQAEGERFVSVENFSGKVGSARTLEDGVEIILADYHLHT